jgi:hypothetical protein
LCATIAYWAELLLVKVLVPTAWPLVACAALFAFRHPVSDGLRRLIRVGMNGAELAPPNQAASSVGETKQSSVSANNLPNDPTLKEWEDPISLEIKALEPIDPNELISRLKRALAASNRVATFEHVGRLIFGTQISLLKHLATSPSGATAAEIKPLFEKHEERLKLTSSEVAGDFLAWIGFLQTFKLIGFNKGTYTITPRGEQFLQEATRVGINELRAL